VSCLPLHVYPEHSAFVHLVYPSQFLSIIEITCQAPVVPATQEAEIRKIMVWSQPGQMIHETLSWKNPSQT
jgi:hypothetical protein